MNTVPRRGPKPKLPLDLRPLEPHEKYCPKCETIKPKTDFYKQAHYDTYLTECKECNIKRVNSKSKVSGDKNLSLQEQINELKKRIATLEKRIG